MSRLSNARTPQNSLWSLVMALRSANVVAAYGDSTNNKAST